MFWLFLRLAFVALLLTSRVTAITCNRSRVLITLYRYLNYLNITHFNFKWIRNKNTHLCTKFGKNRFETVYHAFNKHFFLYEKWKQFLPLSKLLLIYTEHFSVMNALYISNTWLHFSYVSCKTFSYYKFSFFIRYSYFYEARKKNMLFIHFENNFSR